MFDENGNYYDKFEVGTYLYDFEIEVRVPCCDKPDLWTAKFGEERGVGCRSCGERIV
jgi:hypothetical protein